MARVNKPNEEIVVCVESFVSNYSGLPRSVAQGDRLRADDPVVKAVGPKFWVPDGATTAEVAAARSRYWQDEYGLTPR
jgi:hypothetical protein